MIEKYNKIELNKNCEVGIIKVKASEGFDVKNFTVVVESEKPQFTLNNIDDILLSHPISNALEISSDKFFIAPFALDAIFDNEQGEAWHYVVANILLISGKISKVKLLINVLEEDIDSISILSKEIIEGHFKDVGIFEKVSSYKNRSDIIIVMNNEIFERKYNKLML